MGAFVNDQAYETVKTAHTARFLVGVPIRHMNDPAAGLAGPGIY
jgi:hypothetical protein